MNKNEDDRFIMIGTPDGDIEAYVYESYVGLQGQKRNGLVDRTGRVHHYDLDQLIYKGPVAKG